MEPRLCLTMERLLRQLGNRAHERLSIKTYFQPIYYGNGLLLLCAGAPLP
jgi:hypothetical protein